MLSYAAGEGLPEFDPGTAVDVSPGPPAKKELFAFDNKCHRSVASYARLLSADRSLRTRLQPTVFRACSGAVVEDLFETNGKANEGEGPQKGHLNDFTDVVTLSIGGNEVGFRDVAAACVLLADCERLLGASHWLAGRAFLDAFTQVLGL